MTDISGVMEPFSERKLKRAADELLHEFKPEGQKNMRSEKQD
jgi:hypothetical protein